MREKLADLCHRQWAGWMKYLFSKGTFNDYEGMRRQLESNWEQTIAFYSLVPNELVS